MFAGTRLKGSTGGSNLDRDKAPRPAAEYKQLRTLLLALEDRIAAAVGKGETESVQPGEALFDLLASLKITERTAEMIRGEFILIRVWAIGVTPCFLIFFYRCRGGRVRSPRGRSCGPRRPVQVQAVQLPPQRADQVSRFSVQGAGGWAHFEL